MRTQKELLECAYWLSYCLKIGWRKSDLDALEETWWKYHDECFGIGRGKHETSEGMGDCGFRSNDK